MREQAVKTLGTLQEPSARSALHQALDRDENRPIRPTILITLSQLGDRTIIPQISAELQQQRETTARILLLRALGTIEEAPAIRKRLLRYIQKDKDGAVSCELIVALTRADASLASPTLIGLLRDLTTLPGRTAGQMLSWEGAEQTIIACIDALKDLASRQATQVFLDLFERYKEKKEEIWHPTRDKTA